MTPAAPVRPPHSPSPPGRRRVTILVLCWNRWDLTERCLLTLRRNTDLTDVDVMVVDNGSTDETPERLLAYDWLRVVRNEKNLGFVRGNNVGIAAADPESDVLLLNNDVEIPEPGWLDALRKAAYEEPDVGIVGCRLVLPDGKLLHAGTYILADTFWGQQIGSLETDLNQYARTREVQGIVFACAYVKRDVLRAIGGLSEKFESYFEDTDYCLRAREAGFKTVCCGAVTLVHREHGSTEGQPKLFEKIFKTSQEVFSREWKAKLEAGYAYGVHWQSILNVPTGYATSGREMLRELDKLGVRASYEFVYPKNSHWPDGEPENTGDYYLNVIASLRRPVGAPDVSIVYGLGDVFYRNRGRYKIGYTMLEVDGFPDEWVRQANDMDEVWVPTAFNRDGFARSGVVRPIQVMPLGVDVDHFHPGIASFPNPHGDFVFLTNFEWGERKAPELLLRAFNETFQRHEKAVLVCKLGNRNGGLSIGNEIRALGLKESGGRIAFIYNRDIPYHQLGALYRSADCYVSAGRGEGWDMPLLEAMACGLPSIATDWGAHTEFVSAANAYPLRLRGTIPAVALCPYYDGFSWADPDPDHLAELLRHVFENRDEAAEVGRAAARDVAARWTVTHAARRMKARLDEIVPDLAAAKEASRRAVRAAARRPVKPKIGLDVSRAIGREVSGVGRYALNIVEGLARLRPPDLDVVLLPGFASWVHPEYGGALRFGLPTVAGMTLWRGALPAFADEKRAVPGLALVHSTGHAVPTVACEPLLFTVHDLSFLTHPETHTDENVRFCRTNVGRAVKNGATFLAVSESTRRDLTTLLRVPAERVHVVPNAFDDRAFAPASAAERARVRARYALPERFLLFVGSLEPRKNLATVLEALTRLPSRTSLVVAGGSGWRNADLNRLLARAGDRVTRLGFVENRDLAPLYSAARALVYPSLYEGFGLPVLEAMACGTPVVTSRVSSLPEVAGDAGLLLDEPTDAAALAAAMSRLLEDDDEHERRSAAGLLQARRFSLDAVTQRLLDLYRSLLSKQGWAVDARREAVTA